MNADPNDGTIVRAVFQGERSRVPSSQLCCRVGQDVRLSTEALESYCFRTINTQEEELVILAGVIAFTDRTAHRSAARGWRRLLRIIMPVAEPRFWEQSRISDPLIEALGYLSGDAWSFEFVRREGRLPRLRQPELDLGRGEFVVMPFSNGLDSFAMSRLLRVQRPTVSPIRVTAWNHGLAGNRDWVTENDGSRWRRLAVPVKIAAAASGDSTFRTRSFLFSILAGLASHMAEAKSIIIPEAGQGALGPSLVPFGAESPHRGSHPGFSRRMMSFFQAFWGEPILIEHPHLWLTKGEVLAKLKHDNLHAGWEDTRSCPRDQRHLRTGRHKLIQCGVCTGCLLRRLAAASAGLEEADGAYMWSSLSAPSLEGSICADALRATNKNDRDIAVHAVLAMEDLARLADLPDSHPRFANALFEAFGDDEAKLAEGATGLRRLLAMHQNEWRSFTHELGSQSWINRQITMQ